MVEVYIYIKKTPKEAQTNMTKKNIGTIIIVGVITRLLSPVIIVESYDFLNNVLAVTAMGLAIVVLYIVSESKNLIHNTKIKETTRTAEDKRKDIVVYVNNNNFKPKKFFGYYRFLDEDSNH